MQNKAGGFADQIAWLPAGHARRGGVGESDAALEVQSDDAFCGGVQKHLVAAIGAGRLLFGTAADRDVRAQAEKVHEVFAGIEDGSQRKLQPVAMAVFVGAQDLKGKRFPRGKSALDLLSRFRALQLAQQNSS